MDLTETPQANGLDFNTAAPQPVGTSPSHHPLQVEVLKQRLHGQLMNVLMHLFPLGKICPPHFVIGNVQGQQGESLKVELRGPRIGLWHDLPQKKAGIFSLCGARCMGGTVSSISRRLSARFKLGWGKLL